MNQEEIIQDLFDFSADIRYVAIYHDNDLCYRQRSSTSNTSAGETDRFEELLVNPTVLTIAEQRGNIDCGGLRHVIIGYGNFHQLIRKTSGGHISICLEKTADLNALPDKIFDHLGNQNPDLL